MAIAGQEKMKTIDVKHIGESFVSQTPEKTSEISLNVRRGKISEFPEKYLVLSELFDSMVCSIRLLSLRKRSTTFRNIQIQVEILTGRNFQYRNLAQMKYILPEALKLKKVLVQDKKSLCLKPEIYIMLVHDIVGSDHEQSVYVALSDLFTSRMKHFHGKHPEVSDIPEAGLPEPFNEKNTSIEEDSQNLGLSIPIGADLENPSDIPSSFRELFAQKGVTEAEETTTQHLLSCSPGLPYKVINLTNQEREAIISPSPGFERDITKSGQVERCTSDVCTSESKSTPLKLGSEISEITLDTPAQPTPKRSSSCQNKQKSVMNDGNSIGSLTAKRSLMFSHLEDEQNVSDFINEGKEQTGSVQDGLLEAELNENPLKDGSVNIDVNDYSTRDSNKICQHDLTEQQQSSTRLSDFVPVINQIFKSMGWRSITKDELVHKIIVNHCDVDDKSDVERQVEILENLVPDWIYKKLTPSLDHLYSINKVSDLDTILEKVSSSNFNE
ncbi:hypothetical protein LIER_04783 [Lithospermum erythrorhizon]|uniref:CDT1 Geminin-binding domain-containing protein n=1 Tax=Lithospermum erythrorhizon TaxID=34254 RepID=A0AAV3NXZ6_LITER